MKRWIIALILSLILATAGTAYAANERSELGRENRMNSPVFAAQADEDEDEETEDSGMASTQGAIWPSGTW